MEEKENLLFEIKPKFKFIYELLMPTGKKILASITAIAFISVLWIIFELNKTNIASNSTSTAGMSIFTQENIDRVWIFFIIIFLIILIKFVFDLVIQIMQYNAVSYSFYETYMIYEDKFLNKHTKRIQYANIKEVEIKRSIWDRLNKKGIIVLYTNAENSYSNGLVIFALDDAEKMYNKIDEIIHRKNANKKEDAEDLNNEKVEDSKEDDTLKKSEDFKKSL